MIAASLPPKLQPRVALRRVRVLALVTCLVAALSGCYDGSALVQAQHDEVNLVRMDEIDIGKFRITLPRAPGAPGGGVVEFHAFGQVARRDHDDVAAAFKLNGPELRYRVLLLVRSLERKDLDEPKLQRLRDDIATLANASLEHKMIKNVGFYSFTFKAM
jgi:hypothetical protein